MPNCTSSRYAEKRQGTAALQDASAFFGTLLLPQGFGVRLSSAALGGSDAGGCARRFLLAGKAASRFACRRSPKRLCHWPWQRHGRPQFRLVFQPWAGNSPPINILSVLGILSWFASGRRAFSPAILSSILIFAVAGLAGAQSVDEATDWVIDSWQTDAGLPHNSVTAVLQTWEGYLWVGTSNGLARFDGLRFTIFRSADTPGLRSNRILCLYEDAYGALWIGTDGGGLACYHSGHFTALGSEEGLSSDTVLCLVARGA